MKYVIDLGPYMSKAEFVELNPITLPLEALGQVFWVKNGALVAAMDDEEIERIQAGSTISEE